MTPEPITHCDLPNPSTTDEMERWREFGRSIGREIRLRKGKATRRQSRSKLRGELERLMKATAARPEEDRSRWILEHVRLLYSAEKEVRGLGMDLREYPFAENSSGAQAPRVRFLAREFLTHGNFEFADAALAAFIEGVQEFGPLHMGELWALKPAMQLTILEELTSQNSTPADRLISSLERISEANWKEWYESVSIVHRVLGTESADVYLSMDFESRDQYRREVGELAKHSKKSEVEVAEAAVALCASAAQVNDGSRHRFRRTHVGFYLIDRGRKHLEQFIGYRTPVGRWLPRFILKYPTGSYLIAIEFLTLVIVFGVLYLLGASNPYFAAVVLLVLPATQAASDFVNNLVTVLVPPRVLPKLDFSEGIPDHCTTMVAVPSLLLNEAQVRDLVLDLEIRYLANDSPNLYFALLTDSPDSDHPTKENDELVNLCQKLIDGLNDRYRDHTRMPFFMLHRHLSYNEVEGRWMGWERKRGKLLDLNQLLRGTFDAFPVQAGDRSVLSSVKYVIALDSDTQLPRDSAAKLVGTIAHPLNQAVVHPRQNVVVEGYGILQPSIGVAIQSAARSRLASLYSGQTGFDIYTRAASDVYQDLFGEGSFTGKGIYEVDILRTVLGRRFPENALLSHDLIEGAYARVALVSDIQMIDDYPSHFSAYSRRKHRWMRGDWQILRWLRATVPDWHGNFIHNPITLLSKWKIIDNLRRSLLEPALFLLLLGGWLYLPGIPLWWTLLAIAVHFMPVFSGLLFAAMRFPFTRRLIPTWARETARSSFEGIAITICSLIFLPHQALISMDAILRSVGRVFVTRRKLLEWETAAEAEAANRSRATVDIYLEWTPYIAMLIAIAVGFLRPESLPAAAPLLVLWIASRGFSNWLNRPPKPANRRISDDQAHLLRDSADRIWRFFHDWSCGSTNWLIPDSVRDDGTVDLRLSPTNLGMLLNTRIAAIHLGMSSLSEFVFSTRQTLDQVSRMKKYRGHLFNWYDISSLEPMAPRFVSTVDSGNLAASLWTLKQAALAFAAEPPLQRGLNESLRTGLTEIAEISDRLVREMDFRFLYNPRKKVLMVGYTGDADRIEPSAYTLLASESRTATFIAIAKGDIPQKAWFHLGRSHALVGADHVLISWTGTMFEYLMPALWMRSHPDTIIDHTMRAVVRVQREYGRNKGVPWGISEAACLSDGEARYGYAPFGIPGLATNPNHTKSLVISPYSTFLATCVDPVAAAENLTRMKEFGWTGRYGFYESVDYTRAGGEVIRIWMAHHQGMSLMAIVNLLYDAPFQRYFHAEPQVLATELLLHERVPATALLEVEKMSLPEMLAEGAGA